MGSISTPLIASNSIFSNAANTKEKAEDESKTSAEQHTTLKVSKKRAPTLMEIDQNYLKAFAQIKKEKKIDREPGRIAKENGIGLVTFRDMLTVVIQCLFAESESGKIPQMKKSEKNFAMEKK